MAKKRIILKRWWQVRTGTGGEHGDTAHFLGTFFGNVDDIAFLLAEHQCGFYCDGKLTFTPAEKPIRPKLRKTRNTVNVVIEMPARSEVGFTEATRLFKRRPVVVKDCNLYGAFTLVTKNPIKKKK